MAQVPAGRDERPGARLSIRPAGFPLVGTTAQQGMDPNSGHWKPCRAAEDSARVRRNAGGTQEPHRRTGAKYRRGKIRAAWRVMDQDLRDAPTTFVLAP